MSAFGSAFYPLLEVNTLRALVGNLRIFVRIRIRTLPVAVALAVRNNPSICRCRSLDRRQLAISPNLPINNPPCDLRVYQFAGAFSIGIIDTNYCIACYCY